LVKAVAAEVQEAAVEQGGISINNHCDVVQQVSSEQQLTSGSSGGASAWALPEHSAVSGDSTLGKLVTGEINAKK